MNSKKLSSGFILRFFSGENLLQEFTAFLEKQKISSGSFTGLGALQKAEISHYSMKEKKYSANSFEEDLEVISFSGNISLKTGKPFIHSHIVLGKKDFSVLGGHFVFGIVGATMEVFLQPFPEKIERKKDKETELFLLDL
jgi:predicted DNA-binding protein with PD1-like motif